MAFRPDAKIRQQILVLLNLWQESLGDQPGKKRQRRITMKTGKFLDFLRNTTGHKLSYDLLRQYVDSDSTIQALVADLNRNTMAITDPDADQEQPAEAPPAEETPAEEPPAEEPPAAEPPAEEPPAAEPPAEPAAAPPVAEPAEQEKIAQSRRNIIASMAARARKRRE